VIKAINSALENAQDAAVFRGRKSFDEMKTILNQFITGTAISKYLEIIKQAQIEKNDSESNSGKILQYLSKDYQKLSKVIIDSQEFLDNTKNFLDTSILEAKSRIAELEKSDAATVESSYQEICEGLANLRNLMNEIKGDTKCF
jgi:valyl-tRNA synthetase